MNAAEADLKKTANDSSRAKELFDEDAASQDYLEKADLHREKASKNLDMAKEKFKLLNAGARVNQIGSAKFKVNEAGKVVDELMLLQTDSRTFSPINGFVTIRYAEPGEVIGAGTPVLTIINPALDCYLKVYISEKVLGNVRIGQEVKVFTDSDPENPLRGKLIFISNEAEFTPRNIQTKDERIKLVFAAKVKIDNDDMKFKPGMPVDVEFEILTGK